MRLLWLGHSGFRIEIADQVLLLDPWLGNPLFDNARRHEAIDGATHVLVTHGHGDHAQDAVDIAKELNIPVVGIFDLMSFWEQKHGIAAVGFNKGGTVRLGSVAVTMVNATHSSSYHGGEGPVYAGTESGFMIAGEGRTIYVSGDTDVMADMALFEDCTIRRSASSAPAGISPWTWQRAAYAARKFFNFETVIPCHYRTFPLLEQSAETLAAELPGVRVIEPELLEAIEL